VTASVGRQITGYHLDEIGDWVAELCCGHNQHVRHRPPFQLRPWIMEKEGRAAHVGTILECALCGRAEPPQHLRLVRTSTLWDEHTVPVALRRAHRVAGNTWGRLVVDAGQLRFTAALVPALDTVIGPGETQAIPPDVEHHIAPLGAVRFCIEFFVVDRAMGAVAGQHGAPAC
jgi:tellurite methyltransferase